ncbi:putative LRR receptor-like serine/threonine-protein kinase [Arachis hypogaea]|nr:putative LRR receptor-like serine/threonine-protein kinase [Arachis hypogaea]
MKPASSRALTCFFISAARFGDIFLRLWVTGLAFGSTAKRWDIRLGSMIGMSAKFFHVPFWFWSRLAVLVFTEVSKEYSGQVSGPFAEGQAGIVTFYRDFPVPVYCSDGAVIGLKHHEEEFDEDDGGKVIDCFSSDDDVVGGGVLEDHELGDDGLPLAPSSDGERPSLSKAPLKRILESAPVLTSILFTSPVPTFAEMTNGASSVEFLDSPVAFVVTSLGYVLRAPVETVLDFMPISSVIVAVQALVAFCPFFQLSCLWEDVSLHCLVVDFCDGVVTKCRVAVLSFVDSHDLTHLFIIYVFPCDALNFVHSLDHLGGETFPEVLVHEVVGQTETCGRIRKLMGVFSFGDSSRELGHELSRNIVKAGYGAVRGALNYLIVGPVKRPCIGPHRRLLSGSSLPRRPLGVSGDPWSRCISCPWTKIRKIFKFKCRLEGLEDQFGSSRGRRWANPGYPGSEAVPSGGPEGRVLSMPPVIVMSTAATPRNSSASLDFKWDANTITDRIYFYLHFNEIQKLKANETRSFNITLNGQSSLPFHPSSMLLETQKDDVDAITNIKLAYRVTRNWLGDPCGPEAYKWDGLDCNFDGDGIPRITSMNLSTSGLTGHIVPDLLKLTMLKSLDLSNNNLTGDVPYFLAQLQSLQNLNLENNNLSGSIPNELFQKQRDGILSLRYA